MYYDFSLKQNIMTVTIFLGFLGLLMTGCAQKVPVEIPTPVLNEQLNPYLTATPSQTPKPVDTDQLISPGPTDIPAPTPTPFIYVVVESDTLTGIAFRHSVSLENLIANNPGIDPNFLTIGLTLTIPLDGIVSSALPTPTPVPIAMQQPGCHQLADGSLQCMVVVENDQTFAVENVVALISLFSPETGDTRSQTAISPLNIIPAGQKAAVVAIFDPPLPNDYQSQASLLSVIPISVDDQRYLQTELKIEEVAISLDGVQAAVSGSIELLPDQSDASIIWISAFAYDAQNKIIGIRKWIADDILVSGSQVSFDLVVYSLGLPITYVEVFSETRP